ncbi:MAG TPA: class I SAM-dependent methyltransferase, partial [Planctomycetes bacterium]|nr:class I SAM-dependent methyltransferase [Planctomycetota bacterium]
MSEPFDQRYFERFYLDPETRVADPEDYYRLGRFLLAYLDFLSIEIEEVLDLGCGIGHWKTVLRTLDEGIRYRGVEVSEFLCEEFGWERGELPGYRPEKPCDLVICQGVLQYLGDEEAAESIRGFPEMTEAGLYLEVLTEEDWRENCDQERTDGKVFLRRG